MASINVQGVTKIPFKELAVGGSIRVTCDTRDQHKVRMSASSFGKRLDRKFTVSAVAGGMLIVRQS